MFCFLHIKLLLSLFLLLISFIRLRAFMGGCLFFILMNEIIDYFIECGCEYIKKNNTPCLPTEAHVTINKAIYWANDSGATFKWSNFNSVQTDMNVYVCVCVSVFVCLCVIVYPYSRLLYWPRLVKISQAFYEWISIFRTFSNQWVRAFKYSQLFK